MTHNSIQIWLIDWLIDCFKSSYKYDKPINQRNETSQQTTTNVLVTKYCQGEYTFCIITILSLCQTLKYCELKQSICPKGSDESRQKRNTAPPPPPPRPPAPHPSQKEEERRIKRIQTAKANKRKAATHPFKQGHALAYPNNGCGCWCGVYVNAVHAVPLWVCVGYMDYFTFVSCIPPSNPHPRAHHHYHHHQHHHHHL